MFLLTHGDTYKYGEHVGPYFPNIDRYTHDPEVAVAARKGDGISVYKALYSLARKTPNQYEKAELHKILEKNSLFVSPIEGLPNLSTFNGIGAQIYGEIKTEHASAYIGTYYATVFYLPLFPISQYLLRIERDGIAVLGEVPASRAVKRWRLIALFLFIVSLCIYFWALYAYGNRSAAS